MANDAPLHVRQRPFSRVAILALLFLIALSLLSAWIISLTGPVSHGVIVSLGDHQWKFPAMSEALRELYKNKIDGRVEINTHVWVRAGENCRLIIKQWKQRRIFVDEIENRELRNNPINKNPIPAGFHRLRIRMLYRASEAAAPLNLLWTLNSITSGEIPRDRLVLEDLSSWRLRLLGVRHFLLIGSRLGSLALLCVLIVLLIQKARQRPFRFSSRPPFILLILLPLMLWLRISGLNYELPEGVNPDERMVQNEAKMIERGHFTHLTLLYSSGFMLMTAGLETTASWVIGHELPPHAANRFLAGLFSWLTCIAVYSIARYFFSETIAIITCLLFGFSFMPIMIAHHGIIEPSLVFFFLVAFRLHLNILNEPTTTNFVKAGVAAGLALAMKQTAFIIALPFALIFWRAFRKQLLSRTAFSCLLHWLLSAGLIYFLISPIPLLKLHAFYRSQLWQLRSLSGLAVTQVFFEGEKKSGCRLILDLLNGGVGIPMLIGAFAGWVLIWKERERPAYVIAVFAAAYFALCCRIRTPPYHYPLLLCPFLAMLAAYAICQLPRPLKVRNYLVAIMTIAMLYPSLPQIVTLQKILSQTDTRRQATAWFYQNLSPRSRVDYEFFGPRFMLPLFDDRQVELFRRPSWAEYRQLRHPEYYVMDSLTADVYLSRSEKLFPLEYDWYRQVQANQIVREFKGTELGLYNPHIKIYKIR